MLRVAGDNLTDFWQLSATSAGAASVTFALKRRTGGWRRLAVDDSPQFRAFLDAARFRRNEPVHLVAIARGWNGSTSTSRVVPFTVRRR